ncbi:phage tail protein [Sphingomonas sp. MMS24-J45]|uniref:phage tail protein n=1 Tax=Sphingomonas sp. MMS24-J45 TaxID=3238806 RepID=UPI00384D1394
MIGQAQGSDTITLTEGNLPLHTHVLQGGTAIGSTGQLTATPSPTALLSFSNPQLAYAPAATPPVEFSPLAITHTGGGQPHSNAQPRLALLYCIALQGIFPARN